MPASRRRLGLGLRHRHRRKAPTTIHGLATLVGEIVGATIAPTLGGALAESHGLGLTLLMAAGGTAIVFLAALLLKETAHVKSGNVPLQTVSAQPL